MIGVPDEKWGERPLAAVVLRADAPPVTPDELRAFLASGCRAGSCPSAGPSSTEVPKTSVGKFEKTTLRDQYAAGALDVTELGAHCRLAVRHGCDGGAACCHSHAVISCWYRPRPAGRR